MHQGIQILDVVALTSDMPQRQLFRGQVGTVVEQLSDGVFEVEFSGDDGKTYALVAIPETHLLVLRYEPIDAA